MRSPGGIELVAPDEDEMSALRVLFLSHTSPSRYRVTQYFPYLQRHGVQTDLVALPHGDAVGALPSAGEHFHVVFVHRRFLSRRVLGRLRQLAGSLVYDFDDAVAFRSSPRRGSPSWTRRKRFRRMIRNADMIVAGSLHLAELAGRYAPASTPVRVLPTVVDLEEYPLKEPSPSGEKVVLGWIGSRSTLPYLRELEPAFEALHQRLPSVCLKIVCDRFFQLPTMEVIRSPWSLESEVDEILSFDVGLMPLTDDPWSRGKCGAKLIQCMAAGLPVVCSPVGANREIVQHGVEGLYATTPEEWVDALATLAQDPGLRRDMGMRGRAKVAAHYALQVAAPQLLEILHEAAWKYG